MSNVSDKDVGSAEKTYNRIIRCAAKICNNNSTERPVLKFFPFPNNEIFARIWATNAGREDILSKSLFAIKRHVLCADHFEDKYFKTGHEKKTVFRDDITPIPTVFQNNVKYFTWLETRLFAMDDIKANNTNSSYEGSTVDSTMSTDINVLQNDIHSNVEFGRLTYTDDLYEEFVSNPGVLSMKTDVSDRLIKREYCRLCAKQLPIANLVPLFDSRGCTSYGEMLEMCLPGKFKENDKYPHEICSSCINKLENCCKILKSFIEADKTIKNIYSNKETAALINDKINNPNSEQLVEDILNSFEDKSIIMISSDLTTTVQEQHISNNKQEIEVRDQSFSNINDELCNDSVIDTSINNNIMENEDSLLPEIIKNKKIEQDEKLEIKFQCIECLKLFNNKKEVTNHSLSTHTKENNTVLFRVVKAKLRKKENKKTVPNDNKEYIKENAEESFSAKEKSDIITESTEQKYQCMKCLKLYKTKKKVLEHSLAVHPTPGQSKIVCKLVNVEKKIVNKKRAEEQSASVRYECLLCNSHHRTKDTLIKHTHIHHPNLTNGKFLCRILKPKKYRSHKVTCLRCSESFESVIKYRKHMKKHVSFKCAECGMSFDKIYKLKNHSKTHKESKIYNCIGCGEQFNSKGELFSHEEIHKQPKEDVKCPRCSRRFTSAYSLRKHQQCHESWLCNICGKLFPNKMYLSRHIQIHSDERPYKCKVCHKSFKTVAVLIKHKECHETEKKYICQTCGKQFRTSGTLRQHMMIHSTVKKHVCDICGSGFHRRGNLVKHREIHNYIRDELYKCKFCDKVLTNLNSYQYHSRKHKSGDKKPFYCNICNKKFAVKYQLQVHIRWHSGERPYQCDFCEKTFRSKASLNQHRLIHLDVFPHECDFCDRKFRRQQSLIVHRKTHTGERPFPCPICSRAFANRGDMNKHRKIHARKAAIVNELNFNDESVNNADYMDYVDSEEIERDMLQAILSSDSS